MAPYAQVKAGHSEATALGPGLCCGAGDAVHSLGAAPGGRGTVRVVAGTTENEGTWCWLCVCSCV